MNGCRLSITRKFLLRSQVQGNTNHAVSCEGLSAFRAFTRPLVAIVRFLDPAPALFLLLRLMVLGMNVRCSSGLTPSGCCILCSVSLFKAQTVATRSVPVMSSALSIQLLCCHFSHTARVPCEQRWLQYFTLLASPE